MTEVSGENTCPSIEDGVASSRSRMADKQNRTVCNHAVQKLLEVLCRCRALRFISRNAEQNVCSLLGGCYQYVIRIVHNC